MAIDVSVSNLLMVVESSIMHHSKRLVLNEWVGILCQVIPNCLGSIVPNDGNTLLTHSLINITALVIILKIVGIIGVLHDGEIPILEYRNDTCSISSSKCICHQHLLEHFLLTCHEARVLPMANKPNNTTHYSFPNIRAWTT